MQPHLVLKPSDNVFVTVSDTSIALPTPPTDAISGILTVETADVRMRWDGEDPLAGVGGGMIMAENSVWEVVGRDLFSAFRFVRNAGADAYVSVAYMKGE